MSRKSRERLRRRRRRRLLMRLAVCALAVAGFFLIFRLRTVRVRGAVHETPSQITALLLERPICDNTILAWLFNNGRGISSPGFVESLTVTVTGRDSVRVEVHERVLAGCVENGDYWYYFDSSGTVMASAAARTDGELIPPIEGLDLATTPSINMTLPTSNTRSFSMLGMLKNRIDENPAMLPDKVIFEGTSMDLIYGDVTVLMGTGEKLDLRLKELSGVLSTLREGDYKGTLHLEYYDGTQNGLVFDPE